MQENNITLFERVAAKLACNLYLDLLLLKFKCVRNYKNCLDYNF